MPAASIRSAAAAVLIVFAAAGEFALSGCSAGGSRVERPSAPLPGTPACVFSSSISDWQVIDDTTLIVYAPLPKDAYLLKLFEPVPELAFKNRIGFDDADHDGQICSDGDYLLIRSELPQRVPIVAFRKLSAEQVKQLLQAAKPAAASPAPQSPDTGQH